jgi:SAM-dependent methyltransferase
MKFLPEITCRSHAPILDAGCGHGRNAIALAAHGLSVVCADQSWKRLQMLARFETAHAENLSGGLEIHPGQLHTVRAQLEPAFWPFGEGCFAGIVCVHFLNVNLFGAFRSSLIEGGFLYIETFAGQGGNYLALPKAGELHNLLSPDFGLHFYQERKVGPAGYDAVVVRLFARKRLKS